jgi:hypothetical protein
MAFNPLNPNGIATKANSQPVVFPSDQPLNSTDSNVSGTITAADAVVAAPTGNGIPLSGTSTTGSLVAVQSNGGASSWLASITGTLSGTYYFEVSNNSTTGTDGTWINVNGRQTGLVSTTTVADYKTIVTGEFRGSPAAASWFRVRNVGGSGLSTTVVLRMSTGVGPVFLYSSIPSGTNNIGNVKIVDAGGTNQATVKAASTAAVATDTALVVAISPNNTLTVSGSVTANAGTNLNTSLLALDSTVAKDASLTTLNTSVNTLLKPASTLAAVTSVTDASVQGKAASGASKSGNPVQIGGVFNTTQPTVTTGQVVELQSTARGSQIVATGVDTFNATVSGTVTTTPPANASTNLAQVAGTNTVTGGVVGLLAVGGNVANAITATANPVPVGGVFTTTPTTLTTGQTATAQFTASQNLKEDLTSVGGTAIVTGGVAGSQSVGGTVATNVAINANPLNLGVQAVSSENTAVTTARQVQLVADLVGKLIVLPYANPENFVFGTITTAMTGTTSTSLVSAPSAGLRNYITQITVSNSHATIGTDVIIQDGSSGTTLYTIPAASTYGGASITFPTPLRQPTIATALFCANVTTGSSTKVSASGYKGA